MISARKSLALQLLVPFIVVVAMGLGSVPAVADLAGLTRVASGLSEPLYVTHAPGDSDRLFIVQKTGAIRILDLNTGTVNPTNFLAVADTDNENEGGLLGLAFHPDYSNNGKFYVYVTVDNGGVSINGRTSPFSSRVREYTVSSNPDVANPTPREVLSFVQPFANHNAGWIGFNPALTPEQPQYLYITSGDGGLGGDPFNNAQRIVDEKLGKMLRIDVNVPAGSTESYSIPADNPFVGVTGDDEIWAYGLRNPWRASFDRGTGDLFIGDVGQGAREEINRQGADSPGGENYGWDRREGFLPYEGGALLPTDTQPIYDYPRTGSLGGRSVTGGYVYRGPDPDLQGRYFFADFGSSNIWSFDPDNPASTIERHNPDLVPDVGTVNQLASFGEDLFGNLYLVSLGGSIFRIETDNLSLGDYNGDGLVNGSDYNTWRSTFGSATLLDADGNRNNVVDAADYTVWRDNLDGPAAATSGQVPEPSSIVLGVFFGLLLLLITFLRWRFDQTAVRN